MSATTLVVFPSELIVTVPIFSPPKGYPPEGLVTSPVILCASTVWVCKKDIAIPVERRTAATEIKDALRTLAINVTIKATNYKNIIYITFFVICDLSHTYMKTGNKRLAKKEMSF
jgi:hypothetical protein